MKKYQIKSVSWNNPDNVSKTISVYWKLGSASDSTYTLISSSVAVNADGTLVLPLNIQFPDENTVYTIKFVVDGSVITKDVTSPKDFTLGSFLDKINNAMPNMQYTTTESGLHDSYLPEHIGVLYELKSSFGDSLGQYANAAYTVLDNNVGVSFEKRNNELGFKLTSNVTGLYPDPNVSTGINLNAVIGSDGKKAYSVGVWINLTVDELAQTNIDNKLWLWYSGDVTNHIGVYIDTVTKYINWVHKNNTVIEVNTIPQPVIANAWIRIAVRRDGNNIADTYLNQMLMVINGSYYSPAGPIIFTDASNFNGDSTQPVYIGMGKNQSNGNLYITQSVMKYFYYRASVIDNNLREAIMNPFYPRILIQNLSGVTQYTITNEYFVKLTNVDAAFVLPHDVPTGNLQFIVKTYSNERVPISVLISPFTNDSVGFDLDFSNGDVENNMSNFASKFSALHKAWGGYANGGVVGQNIYMEGSNLILECHGENYDGNISGVNRDGTAKTHTIQGDPIWGSDPKFGQAWTERTGGVIVSNDYLGFGRYLIRCKIPQLLGVAPAWWTFHYEEVYQNTPDYELLLSEGLKREGNFADGYYIVRNHEIDIEQPSHLAMGVFNGWNEVETNVIFFSLNDAYHIGIQNDTSDNNGLYIINNKLNPYNKSSWTKVSDIIDPVYNPNFSNFKCNTWIGETGSGSGWRYKDSSIPDSQNDEVYLASLTPIGTYLNDGQFHDYEWKWYKNKVEFYVDGVLKQTSISFIPDIASRLTIGNWFPSGTSSNGTYAPWKADPTKTWAGSPANWNFQRMEIQRILFTPFDSIEANGSNRLIGESYPFDGIRPFSV